MMRRPDRPTADRPRVSASEAAPRPEPFPQPPSGQAAPPGAAARPNVTVELALLGLLSLLWGSSYLFAKIAIAEIPPLTLVTARVVIAALFLSSVVALRGDRLPRDARTWRRLCVQSQLSAVAAWTLLAWGQQHVEAALASVLNSTSPIFVFLMTALFTRHEPLSGLKLAGALLGLAGVTLIVGVDALQGLGASVAGQIACLLGAVCYGAAAIYGKRFGHITPAATAAGTMICASAAMIPFALAIERPWTLAPSEPALLAALALALPCTGAALLIYFRLIRTLGSLGAASQAYLRAGVGALLGVVVLGEQITPAVAAGLAAALVGVAMINWPRRPGP